MLIYLRLEVFHHALQAPLDLQAQQRRPRQDQAARVFEPYLSQVAEEGAQAGAGGVAEHGRVLADDL